METWKATIKEYGSEKLLTPVYVFSDSMFGHIDDVRRREYETRKFLIDFWGLQNPDVEWYTIEKLDDSGGKS